MHKYRNRILFAAAAVVFFPALLVSLLWWDSRPKPDAKISIGYLRTLMQGGSNVVTFVITNQSDFPVIYKILFQTASSAGWKIHYPKQAFSTWPRGTNSSMSTSLISVAPYSTNRWRIEIIGGDATPDVMADIRDWLAWQLRDVDLGAWQPQGNNRARVIAEGPEMNGNYPAPETK